MVHRHSVDRDKVAKEADSEVRISVDPFYPELKNKILFYFIQLGAPQTPQSTYGAPQQGFGKKQR